jgi:hypothetical protein
MPRRDPKSASARFARLTVAGRYGTQDLSNVFPRPELLQVLGVHRMSDLYLQGWPDFVPKPPPSSFFGVDLVHQLTPADVQYNDFFYYLPGDLLRKSDTASMAIGLEVRAPFLETKLIETAMRTELTHLMPHNQRKGLLRQVARKYFPSEIVDRPKMGFAIPIGEWFRSNYGGMRELLYDHLESAEPFGPPSLGIELNMDFVRQMLKEHDDAGSSSLWPWKGRDHSQRLYMLLVLSIWAKWLGGLPTVT